MKYNYLVKTSLFVTTCLSFSIFISCSSSDKNTEENTNSVTEKHINSINSKSNLEKSNLKLLTKDDYWGKKILEKRNSLEGFYVHKIDKEVQIYWYNKKIGIAGSATDGYDSPAKQVKSLLAVVPHKLDNKNYWGKKLLEVNGNLKGLYYDVADDSKTVNIYFYNQLIFKFGPKELGYNGPTNQAKELKKKLPLELKPQSTWGKSLVKKGVSLDGIFYTKDEKSTFYISKYGIDVGELGLKSQGYDSPAKQINNLIANIPAQYK